MYANKLTPCRYGQVALLLNKEEISISVLPPHDALHLLRIAWTKNSMGLSLNGAFQRRPW